MTTKASPRRPSAGLVLGTPGVFRPLSDPTWFLGGGGNGGQCCQAESCPTPSPSGGPSLEPPQEESPGSNGAAAGGGGTTSPSEPPAPTPSPGPMYETEAYGLSQVDFFAGRATSGGVIDPARGNLTQQHAIPAGGPLDPPVVLNYSDAYRGVSDEYPDGWTSNFKPR